MRIKGYFMVILLLFPLLVSAQGADEISQASNYATYSGNESMGPTIVASTSWVGAIAEAAGAANVLVLAPVELRHPPEYDFSPQDIIRATQADLIMWAGYEGFIKQLVSAAEISQNKVIQVQTNNAPDQLAVSVEAVATLLDTKETYRQWKQQLDELSKTMLDQSEKQKTSDMKAVVQFHQQAIARYLGYDVVAVYGPQDLTIQDITKLEALQPDIIIDNWHSPQGEPLKKEGRTYVQLINFPGPFQTTSLIEVITYNAQQLGLRL